jgi:hypothetical protein
MPEGLATRLTDSNSLTGHVDATAGFAREM